MAKIRLGDLLVDGGIITREQLSAALRHQVNHGGRLGTNLVELGIVDERALAAALAKQLSIPSVTQAQLDQVSIDLLRLVPGPVAARLGVVPIRFDSGRLWLAMTDPTDRDAVDEIARLSKKPVRPLVAPQRAIQVALQKHYRVPLQPRHTSAPSFDVDLDQPLGAMPRPMMPPAVVEEELQLDEADVATGYLDDEPVPHAASVPVGRPVETTFEELLGQMANASSDDLVLDAVLRYLSPRVKRIAVLVLQDGDVTGWRGLHVDSATLARTRVSLRDLPLCESALAVGQSFVTKLEPWTLGALAAPLGAVREVLGFVVPVSSGTRHVGVIVGVDAAREMQSRRPELDKLALKIGQALHINQLRRQLLIP
jgi:Type II secretion system (T2SS), protein E, N-terminal domain